MRRRSIAKRLERGERCRLLGFSHGQGVPAASAEPSVLLAKEVLRREREARPALIALIQGSAASSRARRHRNVAWHNQHIPAADAPEADWAEAQRGARLGKPHPPASSTANTKYIVIEVPPALAPGDWSLPTKGTLEEVPPALAPGIWAPPTIAPPLLAEVPVAEDPVDATAPAVPNARSWWLSRQLIEMDWLCPLGRTPSPPTTAPRLAEVPEVAFVDLPYRVSQTLTAERFDSASKCNDTSFDDGAKVVVQTLLHKSLTIKSRFAGLAERGEVLQRAIAHLRVLAESLENPLDMKNVTVDSGTNAAPSYSVLEDYEKTIGSKYGGVTWSDAAELLIKQARGAYFRGTVYPSSLRTNRFGRCVVLPPNLPGPLAKALRTSGHLKFDEGNAMILLEPPEGPPSRVPHGGLFSAAVEAVSTARSAYQTGPSSSGLSVDEKRASSGPWSPQFKQGTK